MHGRGRQEFSDETGMISDPEPIRADIDLVTLWAVLCSGKLDIAIQRDCHRFAYLKRFICPSVRVVKAGDTVMKVFEGRAGGERLRQDM